MAVFEKVTDPKKLEEMGKKIKDKVNKELSDTEFWTEAWIRELAPRYWVKTLGADEVMVRVYKMEEKQETNELDRPLIGLKVCAIREIPYDFAVDELQDGLIHLEIEFEDGSKYRCLMGEIVEGEAFLHDN